MSDIGVAQPGRLGRVHPGSSCLPSFYSTRHDRGRMVLPGSLGTVISTAGLCRATIIIVS